MITSKEQIRNEDGRLLCEAMFCDERWYITVKSHGVWTTIQLSPDGKLAIANHANTE